MPMIITLFVGWRFSSVAMAGLAAEPVPKTAVVMAERFRKSLRLNLMLLSGVTVSFS
jgi:hypothetical protein